jgi:Ca2+-transporting ATPase
MRRPPHDPKQPLMTPRFVGLIAWQGLLLAGVTLVTFFAGMQWYGTGGTGLRHAVTMGFMTLALAQVCHAFNARSQRRSAFTDRLFTNGWLWGAVLACVLLQVAAVYWPPLQGALRTVPLTVSDWAIVAAASLAPVAVVELVKLSQRPIAVASSRRGDSPRKPAK